MPKQQKKEEQKNRNLKDLIIKIILIIIIIILLLHNCCLIKKNGKEETGNVSIIDITCNNNKCQKPFNEISVDCLKEQNNSRCVVPNFIGKDKSDVLRWLYSISNDIEIEIKIEKNPNYKDGTVIDQSVIGTSVKDLIVGKTKLVITIVNNGSLVDCMENSKDSECILPNFVSKNKSDVENWLASIANNIKIKFIYVDSDKPAGTIISQSIKGGSSINGILDKNQILIIYISKGNENSINPYAGDSKEKKNNSKDKTTPDTKPDTKPDTNPETDPELDDDFYVSDKEIVRWQDETNLNIFEDSMYKIRGKIAPNSYNTYKFIVNNETRYTLKYKITFSETNAHNINMKYKLKKGNTYLIDHYVSYNQLNLENMIINSNSSDTYYLEWKWIGDNDVNDTNIGKTASNSVVNYNLKIDVEAESIDG